MGRCLIILFFVCTVSLNALIVKDSSVTVTINGVEKELEKGSSLRLEEGSVVCFKKGTGTVILNNKRSLDNQKTKCYQNLINQDFNIETYLKQKKNSVYVLYSDELKQDKNEYMYISKSLDDGRDLILEGFTKEILLVTKKFKNKPITFVLSDVQGHHILSLKCKNKDITFFKLKTQSLYTGYTLKIFDEYENIVLSKMIIKK